MATTDRLLHSRFCRLYQVRLALLCALQRFAGDETFALYLAAAST